ncbi:MAG: MarR family transcriptional regulator [Actinobacteria bacterium]|nr:MarR family transcriptional regulator [Actinomycetota bacterium]NIS30048.1 MarR family transcriptional regulator [Actinomycetota bacterium]NIT94830.1 MarR family transcriptional regulator [Actinomycetota bacterium]NIU18493.1 MarR family transcriptional regulator [Actinomycetota bacterium]NIU65314.1 MarR family transcriptional regulator [Actinomycetota bacterium]
MDDAATIGEAQRRIVDHLKRVDGATTGAIASVMGVTTQAVRPQLATLEAQGLVVSETLSTGTRGRPPVQWRLSPLAIELFPDRHADLTVELIDAIRAALGDDGLERVLAARDANHLAALRAEMGSGADVADRLEVLAAARTRQGYMAEAVEDGDDLLLVEHHCPVCAAATVCQGLCRNELTLFRAALGDDVEVERTSHLLSGDERCVYRIRRRA